MQASACQQFIIKIWHVTLLPLQVKNQNKTFNRLLIVC